MLTKACQERVVQTVSEQIQNASNQIQTCAADINALVYSTKEKRKIMVVEKGVARREAL